MNLEKLSESALNHARELGAVEADFRFEEIREQSINVYNGTPELFDRSYSKGFSMNVVVDGARGFAADSVISEVNIIKVVRQAVEIAKASASINKTKLELSALPVVTDNYSTPFKTNPFDIPLSEKLDRLYEIESYMSSVPELNSTRAFMTFSRTSKFFASLNGSRIKQEIYQAGCGASCGVVRSHRDRSERSYPTSGGQWITGGYEILDQFDFKSDLPALASECLELSSAGECPQGKKDLVLSGDLVSLQIHESIGHPLELDRVFGYERNFSGVSFATPDKLNKLKYGSDIINISCDSTYLGGLATYAYDDEGVKTKAVKLIENGVLVNYLSDRETASRIGKDSTACCRAAGWMHVPIVRIPNVLLEAGDKTLDEMISEIDDGIYIATPNSWSIDDNREGFTLGGEIGWEIKNGKPGNMIKSPTYSGNTVDFWNSCDAIGSESEWRLWGTPNCGKGQPGQNARTAQGASPCRFRNVTIG